MEEEHTKAPETVKELGIHFGYMREDISDLKKIFEQNQYVIGKEFSDYKIDVAKRMVSMEAKLQLLADWRDKLIAKIAGAAIVGIVLMVLALYGLDKFLSV